jgi:hypothetical protein
VTELVLGGSRVSSEREISLKGMRLLPKGVGGFGVGGLKPTLRVLCPQGSAGTAGLKAVVSGWWG